MSAWGEPIPLGDKYKKAIFSANITGISEGGTVTLGSSWGLKFLAYTPGQSVRVIKASDPTSKFEAIVTSYDASNGTIILDQITNNSGTFGNANYTINLVGERGTLIKTGSGDPTTNSVQGRIGDLYIDTDTGSMYKLTSL